MSFDPISAGFDFAGKLLDKILPDPQARAAAQLQLEQMKQTGDLAQLTADTDIAKAQIAVDQQEASSSSIFISGGRPFLIWVCGFAFAYHFIIQPLLAFILVNTGHHVDLPVFDMATLNTTLMGLLGLGAMRTVEKVKGVAS